MSRTTVMKRMIMNLHDRLKQLARVLEVLRLIEEAEVPQGKGTFEGVRWLTHGGTSFLFRGVRRGRKG